MFPMRLKIGTARNNEWRCCLCLHVRTATVLLGIWHLILHVLALSVLALLMRNHHMIVESNKALNNDVEPNNLLPTPLSKIKDDDNPYYLPTTQEGRRIYSSDMDMGALMTVFTLAITLLLVYGTIKGKAVHLLPFFCLQLFDFAITILTATGYFCYLRSMHRFVEEHWHSLPYRKELLQLSPQCLSLIVLAAFLLSMLWKAYCIGIVWRCYKYLTLRQQAVLSTVHYILPREGSERVPEPDYSSLLRDQEASYANVMKQTPPPSYQDILNEQPPPYPATVHVVNINSTADIPSFIYPTEAVQTEMTVESTEAPANDAAANIDATHENAVSIIPKVIDEAAPPTPLKHDEPNKTDKTEI